MDAVESLKELRRRPQAWHDSNASLQNTPKASPGVPPPALMAGLATPKSHQWEPCLSGRSDRSERGARAAAAVATNGDATSSGSHGSGQGQFGVLERKIVQNQQAIREVVKLCEKLLTSYQAAHAPVSPSSTTPEAADCRLSAIEEKVQQLNTKLVDMAKDLRDGLEETSSIADAARQKADHLSRRLEESPCVAASSNNAQSAACAKEPPADVACLRHALDQQRAESYARLEKTVDTLQRRVQNQEREMQRRSACTETYGTLPAVDGAPDKACSLSELRGVVDGLLESNKDLLTRQQQLTDEVHSAKAAAMKAIKRVNDFSVELASLLMTPHHPTHTSPRCLPPLSSLIKRAAETSPREWALSRPTTVDLSDAERRGNHAGSSRTTTIEDERDDGGVGGRGKGTLVKAIPVIQAQIWQIRGESSATQQQMHDISTLLTSLRAEVKSMRAQLRTLNNRRQLESRMAAPTNLETARDRTLLLSSRSSNAEWTAVRKMVEDLHSDVEGLKSINPEINARLNRIDSQIASINASNTGQRAHSASPPAPTAAATEVSSFKTEMTQKLDAVRILLRAVESDAERIKKRQDDMERAIAANMGPKT
ncbi:unnamed protein product [Vitrella brassicaformis CCMP3155]|uniref:Uncharacterized protein n=4 Tax=Vitrella brassicaformis TaxID=1169539 RepID=A0A0G4FNP8_VITBC|nr:unnamed protein product [Vitrella brassicaformis CCMP3155]|eukprot:CEM15697.1 unnamed protein product [Vitrella brassicaformis CCMP3155]